MILTVFVKFSHVFHLIFYALATILFSIHTFLKNYTTLYMNPLLNLKLQYYKYKIIVTAREGDITA